MATGPGETGNVLAAIASFFLPGLGQLVQGRMLAAIIHFVLWCVLWLFWIGFLMHFISAIDSAVYRRKEA